MPLRNFFLSSLTPADLATLGPLTKVTLERGEALFEPGDTPRYVFFPVTAVISVVTAMSDGRSVETGTIGCESGAVLLETASEDIVRSRILAQVAGTGLRLPARALRDQLLNNPRLRLLLLRHIRANMLQAEQNAACNVLHHIEARLAKWLLMTGDRTGGQSFQLTQDYMAVMAGAQRTTISAAAAQFKAEGLINYSRGQVTILDRPGLGRRACECYAEIRHGFDGLRLLRHETEEACAAVAGSE